jgi:hypothetical protein
MTTIETVILLTFSLITLANYSYQRLQSSREDDELAKAVFVPGDLLIGGLFPIHHQDEAGDCSNKIYIEGILQLETFLHSLDLANEILYNTYGFKLGAIALDSCSSDRVALFNVSF